MTSLRRSVPALVGLLFAGVVVVAGAGTASAQPYPTGSQATALLPGNPLVQVVCPTITAKQVQGATSSNPTVTVSGATVQCTGNAAQSYGTYNIGGATGQYSSQCANSTSVTNGFVDFGGERITGTRTVTFPNGSVAVLNEVIVTGSSVTRNAIRIISGPGAGTVVGQVVCGPAGATTTTTSPTTSTTVGPYPLAVDSPTPGGPSDMVLTGDSGGGGGSDNRLLFAGGALALLVLAQVVVVRRRRGLSGS